MTVQTGLLLEWADGEYLFDLKLPQLQELQEKRGSVFVVYGRVLRGRYLFDGEVVGNAIECEAFAEDFWETIRLGLIGGGIGVVDGQEVKVNAITAKRLVERYGHEVPLRECWAVAAAILSARIEGYDPPKKKAGLTDQPATQTPPSTSDRSSITAEFSEPIGER